LGPEGAVDVLYRRELAAADDPEALRAEKVAGFRDKFANPYVAAERGWVDAIIRPRDTRRKLIKTLLALDTKVLIEDGDVRDHQVHARAVGVLLGTAPLLPSCPRRRGNGKQDSD